MLNSILYLAVFALCIYGLAVVVTPRPKNYALFDDAGNDEITDADFPHCEGGSDCSCKNK